MSGAPVQGGLGGRAEEDPSLVEVQRAGGGLYSQFQCIMGNGHMRIPITK